MFPESEVRSRLPHLSDYVDIPCSVWNVCTSLLHPSKCIRFPASARLSRDFKYLRNGNAKLVNKIVQLEIEKAHPARSESSLRQELREQHQMLERFLHRRTTMVLWNSNTPLPGHCIVFLSTLRSRSIHNVPYSSVTSSL